MFKLSLVTIVLAILSLFLIFFLNINNISYSFTLKILKVVCSKSSPTEDKLDKVVFDFQPREENLSEDKDFQLEENYDEVEDDEDSPNYVEESQVKINLDKH